MIQLMTNSCMLYIYMFRSEAWEARDHNGCTALMFAVANGNEAVTRRLILAQANVNNARRPSVIGLYIHAYIAVIYT